MKMIFDRRLNSKDHRHTPCPFRHSPACSGASLLDWTLQDSDAAQFGYDFPSSRNAFVFSFRLTSSVVDLLIFTCHHRKLRPETRTSFSQLIPCRPSVLNGPLTSQGLTGI